MTTVFCDDIDCPFNIRIGGNIDVKGACSCNEIKIEETEIEESAGSSHWYLCKKIEFNA